MLLIIKLAEFLYSYGAEGLVFSISMFY